MDLDATQALDFSETYESDEEQEHERNRKLVGHLKVFAHQDLEENIYKIFEGENFIGRSERSDVYIPRKSLSKSHACIEVTDDLHLVYDNSSKNKTRRDKVILKPQVRYELKTGDVLTIADLMCQYFKGDVNQGDANDDDDDTGSETGSESMLPIDSTTENVQKDDSSKVYAADTDSDTDDEKVSKDQPPADFKQPKVPNVMYDSNDDDDDDIQMTRGISGRPHPGHSTMIDVSADSETLAFGLISPTDTPVIRPTPKQVIKDTPETLLYPSDTQDKLSIHDKSYTTDKDLLENTPATMLYDTQDNSIHNKTDKDVNENIATTLPVSSAETQDKMLHPIDSPRKHNTSVEPSTVIYEPETQGFSPKDASLCEPTQAYMQESPVGSPSEPTEKVSNVPDSEGEEEEDVQPSDSEIKKVLTFDDSATQEYTWNDNDDTDDEDLRFQPTQPYPTKQGNTEESSGTDEFSNPDLYALSASHAQPTEPANTTDMEAQEHPMKEARSAAMVPTSPYDNEMETQAYDAGCTSTNIAKPIAEKHKVVSALQYGNENLETQAYDVERKDASSTGADIAKATLPHSMMETQAYDAETCNEGETQAYGVVEDAIDKKETVPSDMMGTQAYGAEDDFSKNKFSSKAKKTVHSKAAEPTLAYDFLETQAFVAEGQEDVAGPECSSKAKNTNKPEALQPTLAYDINMETQAYEAEAEEDANQPRGKSAEKPEALQPTLAYDINMETQAYEAEAEDDVDQQRGKSAEKSEAMQPTLAYDMMETQAYQLHLDMQEEDGSEPDLSTEPHGPNNITGNTTETFSDNKQNNDLGIQETQQAHGEEDDSETDDETSENVNIENQKSNEAGNADALDVEATPQKEDQLEITGDKGMTVTDNKHGPPQDYGIDERIPDSEAFLSQEIPPHEINEVDDATNNNLTDKTAIGRKSVSFEADDSKISQNVEETPKEAQEETEIIIRPMRRGRGRVTQPSASDDQSVVTQIPKASTGRQRRGRSTLTTPATKNEPKVTENKSGKNEKQMEYVEEETGEESDKVGKGKNLKMSVMELTKSARSTRSKKSKDAKPELEQEEMEGSFHPEVDDSSLNVLEADTEKPSTRGRRARKSTTNVKPKDAAEMGKGANKEDAKEIDNTVDVPTKSVHGRRSRKITKDFETTAVPCAEDSSTQETELDNTVDVPKSLRGKRTKTKHPETETTTLPVDVGTPFIEGTSKQQLVMEPSVGASKPSSRRTKKNKETVQPDITVVPSEEGSLPVEETFSQETELDSTVTKSSQGRRTRKTKETVQPDITVVPSEEGSLPAEETFSQETELDSTVSKSSQGRRPKKTKETVQPDTTVVPLEEGSLPTEETFSQETELDSTVTKSSRGRRTRKTKETVQPDATVVRSEEGSLPAEETFSQETELHATVSKSSRGRRTRKSKKDVVAPEEDSKDEAAKVEKSLQGIQNQLKNVPDKTNIEHESNTTNKPFELESNISLEKLDLSQTTRHEESMSQFTVEIPGALLVHVEDSEEDVFISKKRGRGKRKGVPAKRVVVADEFSEMDSDDLPALGIVLSDKKPMRKSTKKESPSKTSMDYTTEVPQEPAVAKVVPSRRGRGRVTQSDDSIPGILSDTSIAQLDNADLMSPNAVAKSLSARRGRGKNKTVAAEPDITEEFNTPSATVVSPSASESQSSTSSVASKSRGKRTKTVKNTVNIKTEEVQATPAKRKKDQNKDDTVIQSPSLRERKQLMPRVMFTGVTDKQAEKIVLSLGGTLEESVYECTHLITDKVRRTVKFLCGVASGQVIVLPSWLTECKKSKKFIDPEPFFVNDKAAEKLHSFSLKQSHEQALKGGLLDGYKIHVTKSVKPDPLQMKDIIQCAKGEFLPRIPRSMEEKVLVVSCDSDFDACKPAIACGISVYTAELLLTGILRQELSLEENRLFLTETSAEEKPSAKNTGRKRRNESVDSEQLSQSASRSSKRKKK